MKFVSKDLALKLKEKGFNRPCFGWYYINIPAGRAEDELILNTSNTRGVAYEDLLHSHNEVLSYYSADRCVDAPTTGQVLKWLREEKNIHINVNALPSLCKNFMTIQEHRLIFDVRVSYFKEEIFKYYDLDEPYFNYEDACIAGIEYIIDNLI